MQHKNKQSRISRHNVLPSNNQDHVRGRRNISQVQRPNSDNDEEWSAFWKTQNQDWRIKPEISSERQAELDTCRNIKSNHKKGIYPFKGIELERADIEWLLATHENGRGYVDWKDTNQQQREGLDVRGANLSGKDLSNLPLTHLRGGLTGDEWSELTDETLDKAARVNLNRADLQGAHLEGACLREAYLENASLGEAHLEGANLINADMKDAFLIEAHLEGANLIEVSLEDANLKHAHLKGASLFQADLRSALLSGANLNEADLSEAHLENAKLVWANLTAANLSKAYVQKANFRNATLHGVNFSDILLWDDNGITPLLADAQWEGVNLAVIDWSKIKTLGDEYKARKKFNDESNDLKAKDRKLQEYEQAVRANRQLAVALQAQGLNEEAARFAYHARVLNQKALWMQLGAWLWIQKMKQRKYSIQKSHVWMPLRLQLCTVKESKAWEQWLKVRNRVFKRLNVLNNKMQKVGAFFLSFFFGLLTGYGYRPKRAVISYLVVISGFCVAYSAIGHQPLLPDAIVLSLLSFHGRGFFPSLNGEETLHSPLVILAAAEAVVGLFIEMSFIATFTQRFFKG